MRFNIILGFTTLIFAVLLWLIEIIGGNKDPTYRLLGLLISAILNFKVGELGND